MLFRNILCKNGDRHDAARRLALAALGIGLLLVAFSFVAIRSSVDAARLATPITGWNSTTQLPQATAGWNAIEHDGRIYFLGGRTASGDPTATVYMASIQSSGGLGGWSQTTPLPVTLYLHSVSATDTHVFVVGGWDGVKTRPEVYSAPFLPGGGIGPWSQAGTYPDLDPSESIGIDLHGTVIVNNRLYVLGGWTGTQGTSAVRYATINGGTIGAWQTGPSLPKAVYRLAAVAHDGFIYVTGGVIRSGEDVISQADVYVARVNADGSLGNWQTSALPEPRHYHRAVVHDGRLVVLGGRSDVAELNSVRAAPINANGTLGAWDIEPPIPQSRYRFAATTATLHDSEYIFVLGGLVGEAVQSNVYYSTAPPPPTPTPTPTPTPQPNVSLTIDNDPAHWLAPGDEVTYTLHYLNSGEVAVEDLTVSNVIPENAELVPESVAAGATVEGSTAGSALSWNVEELDVDEQGAFSYRVRRIVPTPSASIPSALRIALDGPEQVEPGEPIQFTLTITNEVPISLNDVVVTNTLPDGARYVEGSGGTLNGRVISWLIPEMAPDIPGPPRIPSTVSVQYVVRADQTIVNHDYRVTSQTTSGPGPTGVGKEILVTHVGDTPPVGLGDGVVILNDSATISWEYQGATGMTAAAPVRNPALQDNRTYLPLVLR